MKLIKTLILLVLVSPLVAQAEDAAVAKIVTSMSNEAQCIVSVHIRNIDGREVQVNRGGFELEPGRHTMSGTKKINTSFCMTVGRAGTNDNSPPLEADFEAGKTYWVGFDHSARDRKDWKYVIWKVKD